MELEEDLAGTKRPAEEAELEGAPELKSAKADPDAAGTRTRLCAQGMCELMTYTICVPVLPVSREP